MPAASMKQLLESGVHFGHQTRRWNPKMKPYIFTERGGIHIIDLQQTTVLLDKAYEFVRNIAGRGGTVLFVGTKKQCQDVISQEAGRVGMPYVSHRWLGGLLTNFATIDNRIKRMHELRKLKEEGQLSLLPTKERMGMERELEKLEVNLGGVGTMSRLPDAVFVADPKREAIAVKEVNKLGLPLIGLCDTNCDPDEVEYLIPGNDDAIRSCSLIMKTLAKAVEEGRQKMQVSEFLAAEAARSTAQRSDAAGDSEEADGDKVSAGFRARGARGPGAGGDDRPRGQRRVGIDNRSGTLASRRSTRDDSPTRPAPARRPPRPTSTAGSTPKSGDPTPPEETKPVVDSKPKEAVDEVTEPVKAKATKAEEAPAAEQSTPAMEQDDSAKAPEANSDAGAASDEATEGETPVES